MRHLLEGRMQSIAYGLQIIVAFLLCIGVFVGLIDLVKYFYNIFHATPGTAYTIVEAFLAYALLLIVGVELILMILNHSTDAILELVLFVIARKMLIYAHTSLDVVYGTLALAIIFWTLKYMLSSEKDDVVNRNRKASPAQSIFSYFSDKKKAS